MKTKKCVYEKTIRNNEIDAAILLELFPLRLVWVNLFQMLTFKNYTTYNIIQTIYIYS